MLGGIVRGRRTTLRTPAEADLSAIAAWMADMRVRRLAAVWKEPAMPATWKERLGEQAKEKESVLWAIDGPEGLAGVARIEYPEWSAPMASSVDITDFVIAPDHWRRGLGSDAALALHRYVFDYLHLSWSALALRADNVAALRIADRLGYRRYAHGHAVHYRAGSYVDEVRLRMDLATWDERWTTEREYPLDAAGQR
jgi:RimJ/RimL family protein N-acetyltransferase